MSYDDAIDRILQEAYFSSPYEKATGIKRQVETPAANIQEDDDFDHAREVEQEREKSSFKQDQDSKSAKAEYAAEIVAGMVEARAEDGNPVNKKELGEMAFAVLRHYQQEGDEFSLPEIGAYFKNIKELTGTMPMSTERVRNLEKGGLKKMRNHPDIDPRGARI